MLGWCWISSQSHSQFNQTIHKWYACNDVGVMLNILSHTHCSIKLSTNATHEMMLVWCWMSSQSHSQFNQTIHKCYAWNGVGLMLNIPSYTHSSTSIKLSTNATHEMILVWCWIYPVTLTVTVQSSYPQMLIAMHENWNGVGLMLNINYNPHTVSVTVTLTFQSNNPQMLCMKLFWLNVEYPHGVILSQPHSVQSWKLSSNKLSTNANCYTWNDVGLMLSILSHTHTCHSSNYPQMLCMKWCWFNVEYNPHSQ